MEQNTQDAPRPQNGAENRDQNGLDPKGVQEFLQDYINGTRKGLRHFYNPDEFDKVLKEPVEKGVAMSKKLLGLQKNPCGREVARSLCYLTLYDIVMLIDDSISMKYEQGGQRIETLKKTLRSVSGVYSLASRKGGITGVEFLNQKIKFSAVKPGNINALMGKLKFDGLTPIGTQLSEKVLRNYADVEKMEKPLLVIILTDGEIEGERNGLLRDVIVDKAVELKSKHGEFGPEAVSYQFAQIGNDRKARELVKGLDDDSKLGKYIDCLVEDEHPLEEIDGERRWEILSKLFLGAITRLDDEDLKNPLVVLGDEDGLAQNTNEDEPEELEEDEDDGFGD